MSEWWLFRRRIIGWTSGLIKRISGVATIVSVFTARVATQITSTASIASAFSIQVLTYIFETAVISSVFTIGVNPLIQSVAAIASAFTATITTAILSTATVTSVYDVSTAPPPPPSFGSDNFDDDTIGDQWSKLEAGTGSVAETNQQLECTISANGDYAGLVSAESQDIDGKYVEIDVTQLDNVIAAEILICLTKTTNSNPHDENDWYRIIKYNETNAYYVQRRISGAKTTRATGAWAGSTGKLRIYHDGTNIKFYENGNLRLSEAYALGSSTVYIYIYHGSYTNWYGTDLLDDFLTDIA